MSLRTRKEVNVKRIIAILNILLFGTILLFPGTTNQEANKVVVTYIASEGFFIEAHNKKILVEGAAFRPVPLTVSPGPCPKHKG